jgi:transposase
MGEANRGVDDRRVISGMVHVLRSGCRWKDAPAFYGPRKTLYNRFVRWARLFIQLSKAGGPPAALMLDATHAKARRSSAGGKGGPKFRPSGDPEADGRPKSTRLSTSTDARAA